MSASDGEHQPGVPPTWGQPGHQVPQKPSDVRPLWKKKRVLIPSALLALIVIAGNLGNDNTTKVESVAKDGNTSQIAAEEAARQAAADRVAAEAAASQAAADRAAAEAAQAAADKAATEAAQAQAAANKAAADKAAAAKAAAALAAEKAAADQARQQALLTQPEPAADSGGTDPRFRTCKEAKANGYGNYTQGVDTEYEWYRDADSDGVVCE
jgi:hypothetical protein